VGLEEERRNGTTELVAFDTIFAAMLEWIYRTPR